MTISRFRVVKGCAIVTLLMAVQAGAHACSGDAPKNALPPPGADAGFEGDGGPHLDAPGETGDESGESEAGADSTTSDSNVDADADTGASAVKYILGPGRADFAFELQDLAIGYHTGDTLDEAVRTFGLGDVTGRAMLENAATHGTVLQRVDSEGFPITALGEWDYSCIHLSSSEIDGAGLPRSGFPCFDSLQGCDDPPHAGVAYDRAHAYYGARRDYELSCFPSSQRLISHTGHYLFPHYGAAWGAAMVVSEVGENINSIQAHIAFLRGASRQFNVPWGTDFSPWFADGMLDYWTGADRVWYRTDSNGNIVDYYSGADHGHSLSLTRRTWYLSFACGASYIMQEGASVNFFLSKQAPTVLSPLGQLAQEFHSYVSAHPDRGAPYVPMAIVTDFYHGLGLGTWSKPPGQEVSWNHFPLGDAQRATLGLLEAFFPGSFKVTSASEANYMVNGPVGDTVEVLADLDDPATQALLASYRVVLLSGDVHWTPQWKSAVWNGFLASGGWLVLDVNPAHDAIFADLGAPALSAFVPGYSADQIGMAPLLSGAVVRVSSPSHYPALLPELGRMVLPFAITGAGFALSRKPSGAWLLTLLNNSGVDKQPRTPTVITAGAVAASVTPRPGHQLSSVTALRSAHPPAWSATGIQVQVDPGDVGVLEVDEETP